MAGPQRLPPSGIGSIRATPTIKPASRCEPRVPSSCSSCRVRRAGSVAGVKDRFSKYVAQARKKNDRFLLGFETDFLADGFRQIEKNSPDLVQFSLDSGKTTFALRGQFITKSIGL